MKSHWKAWIESDKEAAAGRVVRRLFEELGFEGERWTLVPYDKGGFELSFEIAQGSEAWPEAVYHLLSLAQRLGYGWRLLGSIDTNANLVLSTSGGGTIRVSGVTMVEGHLERPSPGP